jgi:hypothetical protein
VKRKKGVEYLAIVVFAAEPRRQMPPGETALDRLKAFKTKLAKLEMFRAASGGSANAFQPVSVNIYKFVQLKKCFNLRPDAAEQRVKIFFSKITETQMHNGGGIWIIIRSEKSASLLTITNSRWRANSQTSESVGLEPKSETKKTGSFGENSIRCGRFSSKKKPFMQSARRRNDCP